MNWWCTSIGARWSWDWRAYPGVWLAMAAILVPYVVAVRRRGPMSPADRRRMWFFVSGVALLWVATDWPLGLLGASYLASAHMVQFMLYTLGAAPLLMLGVPEWMARRMLSRLRGYRLVSKLAHPFVAAVTFNAVLVATHAPWTVDNLRSSQFGSFAMDFVWLLSGLVLWLPILAPLPELANRSYPVKIVYLFAAAGIVPVLPASFLTFATFPLYATYELAPRFYGLAAGDDQTLAGLIMKVGSIPVVWGTMLAMTLRWAREEGVPGLGEPTGPTPSEQNA